MQDLCAHTASSALKTTKPTAHAAHASIQSIIKRTVHKPPPRMREELDDLTLLSATNNSSNLASSADPHADSGQSVASTSNAVPDSEPSSREALMKQLLRPPLIDGVEDWGVPEAPSTPCDPALQVSVTCPVLYRVLIMMRFHLPRRKYSIFDPSNSKESTSMTVSCRTKPFETHIFTQSLSNLLTSMRWVQSSRSISGIHLIYNQSGTLTR